MKIMQISILNLSLAAFGWVTLGVTEVTAQAINQSNTSGFIPNTSDFAPPFIDSSGFGGGINSTYDPSTGTIDFKGLGGQLSVDPNGEGLARRNTGTTGELQKVSINDIAKLLETDLNQSLEDLAKAEDAQKAASAEPRRIARNKLTRRSTENCVDPSIEARSEVEKKLEQSQKFIEEVDLLKPGNSIW